MTKYLLTNYGDVNLWYHHTLFMLDTVYLLRKNITEKIDILSQTKLGDYSKVTYYDDEIFINWYNKNRDELIDWTELKEGQKFQMCNRNIISNAIFLGFNKYGFLTYREEGKSIDFCITGDKLVLLIEN